MKKTIIPVIIALCTLCFTTCQTISAVVSEPIVSLHSVDIASINFNGAQLLCKIQIENPNAIDIPFPEVGWQLFLNSHSLVSGTVRNNQRLKAKNTTIVEIPVNLEYLSAFNAITSLKGRNAVNYKVALALKFNLALLGEKVWNLEHEGNIPLPQLPRVASPAINFENVDVSNTTVVFTVNIQNPNNFELPPPKINFDFQVNRNSVVNSDTSTAGGLRPSSTTPVQVRFAVNPLQLAQTLGSSLLTARSIGCNLNVSFDFGIPAFGDDRTTIQVPGTFPLR